VKDMNAHDERISSFLDDAMPAAERSAFESELLDNAELRQQVIELRQLRQDVALLPRYSVTEGFAQRVVAAAISAKANENANIALASKPSTKTVRRATIGVIAIAASVLIMVGTMVWNNSRGPVELANPPKVENKALAPVLAALPDDDQVLVVRITSPKGTAAGNMLRAALAEQGIEKKRPSDQTTGGGLVRKAYKEQVGAAGTEAAADALYLQISPEELELALARLAEGKEVKLVPGQLLAMADVAPKPEVGTNTPAAEDIHGNPAIAAEPGNKTEFMQDLTPSLFKLPKEHTAAAPAAGKTPKGKVRVLILIEQAK
jgi:hypothetical protein